MSLAIAVLTTFEDSDFDHGAMFEHHKYVEKPDEAMKELELRKRLWDELESLS